MFCGPAPTLSVALSSRQDGPARRGPAGHGQLAGHVVGGELMLGALTEEGKVRKGSTQQGRGGPGIPASREVQRLRAETTAEQKGKAVHL